MHLAQSNHWLEAPETDRATPITRGDFPQTTLIHVPLGQRGASPLNNWDLPVESSNVTGKALVRWIKSAPVAFDLKRALDENRKTKLIPSNGSTPRLKLLQRMITEHTGSFLVPKLAEFLLQARLGVSASDDELRQWLSYSPTKI